MAITLLTKTMMIKLTIKGRIAIRKVEKEKVKAYQDSPSSSTTSSK